MDPAPHSEGTNMSTATVEEPVTLGTKANKVVPITLTEKAASEVRRIAADQAANTPLYLRVRVVGGGCSGFQHKLDLDETVNEKLDEIFELHGVNIVIDKRSMLYLDGVTVDFHDDLNKRGFSVTNPSAKTTCGCGSSFSM